MHLRFAIILLSALACACVSLPGYDQTAYENATSLKARTLALVEKAAPRPKFKEKLDEFERQVIALIEATGATIVGKAPSKKGAEPRAPVEAQKTIAIKTTAASRQAFAKLTALPLQLRPSLRPLCTLRYLVLLGCNMTDYLASRAGREGRSLRSGRDSSCFSWPTWAKSNTSPL